LVCTRRRRRIGRKKRQQMPDEMMQRTTMAFWALVLTPTSKAWVSSKALSVRMKATFVRRSRMKM
jgi:hypothetical protein